MEEGRTRFVDRKGNRLAAEKSPYLLQHAGNPVDWFPWGEEAFARAKAEDKPLFVSIGYSTCHWCHVMERESFSDRTVAEGLNDAFVSVKVDREERPDLDWSFMEVCRMVNGSGGWPLNVLLTPGGLPFFAASYIPRSAREGGFGMLEVIPRVKWLWKTKRQDVERSAESISRALSAGWNCPKGPCPGVPEARLALEWLRKQYDPLWGGFSKAPKFPSPPALLFLLGCRKALGEEDALEMARHTIFRIWSGGIHDHLGGGIARYATDDRWLMPHFEKMLCDQALLLLVLAEAWLEWPDPLFREFADDIASFVLGSMRSPEGGFYSGFDADSEGEEGKYYTWTEEEIRSVLPGEDGTLFLSAYGVKGKGNSPHAPEEARGGRTVLALRDPLEKTAESHGLAEDSLRRILSRCRARLLKEREKRVPPFLDDKILTDWNGLMIAGLSRASSAFGRPDWLRAAEGAAEFLRENLMVPPGNVLHRYRDREAGIPGFLDDYAFFAWGLAELGKASGKAGWVRLAEAVAHETRNRFLDVPGGGFFFSSAEDPFLFLRRKEAADGALPSGNAAAVAAFFRVASLTGRKDLAQTAVEAGETFSGQVSGNPQGFLSLLRFLVTERPGREAFPEGGACDVHRLGI